MSNSFAKSGARTRRSKAKQALTAAPTDNAQPRNRSAKSSGTNGNCRANGEQISTKDNTTSALNKGKTENSLSDLGVNQNGKFKKV